MVANRALILEHAFTTLEGMIGGAYDYPPVRVDKGIFNVAEVAVERCPFLFVFPDQQPPNPEYQPFGVVKRTLVFWVGAIVHAPNATDGSRMLSQIQEDVASAMEVDPMRGGAAVMTMQDGELQADEWRAKDGDGQRVMLSGLMKFRSTYYPREGA